MTQKRKKHHSSWVAALPFIGQEQAVRFPFGSFDLLGVILHYQCLETSFAERIDKDMAGSLSQSGGFLHSAQVDVGSIFDYLREKKNK